MAPESLLVKKPGIPADPHDPTFDAFAMSVTPSTESPRRRGQHPAFLTPQSASQNGQKPQSAINPQFFAPHPFYFQDSPPQDSPAELQSALDELGQKRRRVSGYAAQPGFQTPAYSAFQQGAFSQPIAIPKSEEGSSAQNQPLTPQTPTYTNTTARELPTVPIQGNLHMQLQGTQIASQQQMQGQPVSMLAYPPPQYTQIAQIPPSVPPSVVIGRNAAPAVISKPPVVPSLVGPRRPAKPQEVALPKVVDPAASSDPCDDEDGHYVVKRGERFAGRYLIIKQLGQGTFGKVAQAWDERLRTYVAVKIIRAIPKYRDASKIELRVLAMLSGCDPVGRHRCVRMLECFDYRNHVCIVTGLHDVSIYDFLKDNSFMPFPGRQIASFAHQVLTSVAYIHSLGLVHTDLKPENVLLTSSEFNIGSYRRIKGSNCRRELKNTEVTLIDFGSAVFDDEYHSSVVSTRHYRAPEIIFGTGWSFPCDMWSIGCVLIELCTGRVLFETRDNLEHLHMMEKTLSARFGQGQLNRAAAQESDHPLVIKRGGGSRLRPLTDHAQINAVEKMRTIPALVQAYAPFSRERRFWDGFLDFVARLMTLDPAQRLSAEEALRHPWIVDSL